MSHAFKTEKGFYAAQYVKNNSTLLTSIDKFTETSSTIKLKPHFYQLWARRPLPRGVRRVKPNE